MLSQCGDTVA